MFSWLGRTLATYVAAGYMTDGKENQALKMAQTIAMDQIESQMLKDAVENEAENPTVKEPAIGSYERIMARFGGVPTYDD